MNGTRKWLHRIIAVGCAALLLLSSPVTAATAATSEPNAFGDGVISEEKITLTALVASTGDNTVFLDPDGTQIWYFEELEKRTNIHVDFELVSEADWNMRINLMFATEDYVDMILCSPVDIEEYGVSQGLLVPLDDYIEANMPNYYSRLHMNGANVSIPASDGKMYYIGKLIAQNINHEPNFYINKTWLDNLDLPIPTTVEELTNTLRAFRDGDPTGTGATIFPASFNTLNHYCNGIYPQFAMFGVPLVDHLTTNFGFINIDPNDSTKVIATPLMEGFRPALEWLHLLYSEGLMDMESIIQDNPTFIAKINEGKVGYTTHLRLINSGLTPEAAANYVSILPPSSDFDPVLPRILEIPTMGAVLTTANQHIEETLQWIDAQLETEIMMVGYNGPVKEEFGPTRREDGTVVAPPLFINDSGKYEVSYIPEDNKLYDYVPVLRAQFFAPGDYYFDIYEMAPHRIERAQTSKEYDEAGVLEKTSYDYLRYLTKKSNDEAIEAQRIHSELRKLMEESVSNFITRGVTDASWDAFIKTVHDVGLDKYVEIYQTAYDRYLASNQ